MDASISRSELTEAAEDGAIKSFLSKYFEALLPNHHHLKERGTWIDPAFRTRS